MRTASAVAVLCTVGSALAFQGSFLPRARTVVSAPSRAQAILVVTPRVLTFWVRDVCGSCITCCCQTRSRLVMSMDKKGAEFFPFSSSRANTLPPLMATKGSNVRDKGDAEVGANYHPMVMSARLAHRYQLCALGLGYQAGSLEQSMRTFSVLLLLTGD